MNTDKRLIEESFPVKELSAESAREKNFRHGYISTLHIWWARKPLAVSRATAYAALVPSPKDHAEWQKQRNFIIELSKWENSNNYSLLKKARADILRANKGVQPKMLDPFGGGGSIPFEALRLGCETYSSDYNPVAVLIQKCTIEYPSKYGDLQRTSEWGEISEDIDNPLLEKVKIWGDWVLKEVKKEIDPFYSIDEGKIFPVGSYWMRTVPCQNPNCGAEIPLTTNYWLVKKKNADIALLPAIENNKINFSIVGYKHKKIPDNFNPDLGTVSGAVVTCPCCGNTIDPKTVRNLFYSKKASQRLIAIINNTPDDSGKIYRLANLDDVKNINLQMKD